MKMNTTVLGTGVSRITVEKIQVPLIGNQAKAF